MLDSTYKMATPQGVEMVTLKKYNCHSQVAPPKCVEVVTLQQCVDKLATGISIDPVSLANKLLEKGLTSQRLVEEMVSTSKGKYDKATELVVGVINIVKNYPGNPVQTILQDLQVSYKYCASKIGNILAANLQKTCRKLARSC